VFYNVDSKSSFLFSVNSSFANDCWIVFGNINSQSAYIILYFLSAIELFSVVWL
jgi:hypothetical protein